MFFKSSFLPSLGPESVAGLPSPAAAAFFAGAFFAAAGLAAAADFAAGFLAAAGLFAAGFLAAGFVAAGFLAAGFLAADVEAVVFAGAFSATDSFVAASAFDVSAVVVEAAAEGALVLASLWAAAGAGASALIMRRKK